MKLLKFFNEKETVIREVDNFDGLYEFYVNKLQPNSKYGYYIKVHNTFSNIYTDSF